MKILLSKQLSIHHTDSVSSTSLLLSVLFVHFLITDYVINVKNHQERKCRQNLKKVHTGKYLKHNLLVRIQGLAGFMNIKNLFVSGKSGDKKIQQGDRKNDFLKMIIIFETK